MGFCEKCGKEILDSAEFCMGCGVANNATANSNEYSDKNKTVAGLLQIFLGSYGIGRFYLGSIKIAVTQLVISLVGLVFYIISFVLLLTFSLSNSNSDILTDSQAMEMLGYSVMLLVSCLPLIGVGIWTFIDGLMLLCSKNMRDGKGKLLR